jgi:hypothetical protein
VGRRFLEAADLPVGRSAITWRASPARKIPRWRRNAASRPSRSSAASKRVRLGRGGSSLPRSGRPPGRPEREHVASSAGTQGPAIAPQRGVPAEQELGRFEEGETREGWVVASSKRPTSRSAGARSRGEHRRHVRSRDGAATRRPRRAGARPQSHRTVLEAADLPVGRTTISRGEHRRHARSRVASRRGVPAEQELGRFEEGEAREGRVVASSKRPTSRSAGARARGEHRRHVGSRDRAAARRSGRAGARQLRGG